VLGPIQNFDSPVVGYPVDYLEYHFDESMVTVVRDLDLAIVETAAYFDSNSQHTVRVVPERVEHCSPFAKRMPGKDRCQPGSLLVPTLGRYHLWNALKVTVQSELGAEVRHWYQCLRIV
jgi:hypothetical protein